RLSLDDQSRTLACKEAKVEIQGAALCRDGRAAARVHMLQFKYWGRCAAIAAQGRSYTKWWVASVLECSHTLMKETDL
ncbi:hypothetical protein, partial [Pseudomonas sp. DE0010]|uniref:hypothetical protein n=1 Tax=Pseudomonas sp. DE0010 TaxID=2584951 RepID=UPI001C498C72